MPITALPTPPTRQDPSTFSSRADSFLSALPTFATEANALAAAANINETNSIANAAAAALSATNANNSALAAASSASQLLAAANYKGAWSTLSGALNKPASVTHSGKFWLLNTNVADVTAKTPGVAAEWTELPVLQSKQILSDTTGFTPVSSGEDIMRFALLANASSLGKHLCLKSGSNYIVIPYNTAGTVYWTSTDTITWTQRALPASATITGATVNGTSVFLFTTGTNVLSSTDSGATFTNNAGVLANVPTPFAQGFAGSTYFAFQAVSTATATYQTSANGTSWSNGGTNPLPLGGSASNQINLLAATYISSSTTLLITGNANGSATTQAASSTNNGAGWTARTLSLSGLTVKLITNGSGSAVGIVNGSTSLNYTTDSGANWSTHAAGYSSALNGGCYQSTGTVWCAVGAGPSIYTATSPNGTWTSRTSNSPSTLNDAGSSGSAMVAVGNSGAVVTSPDGTTWTNRTATSNTSQHLYGVDYNGSTRWCAVGVAGTIITSDDGGVNWTVRTSGVTNTLRAVKYANSRWVVVGDSGTVLTSTDGITWTIQTRLTDQNLMTVNYTGSVWFITGYNSLVMVSTDGTATAFTAVLNTNLHNSALYVGKKPVGGLAWIWYRGSAFYWTSSNGTTWTPRCAPGIIGQFSSSGLVPQVHPDGTLRGLSVDRSTLYESSNGTTWSSSAANLPQYWPSIVQQVPIKLNGTFLYPEYSNSTYQVMSMFTSPSVNSVNWGRRIVQGTRSTFIDAFEEEFCWEFDNSVSPPRGMVGGSSTAAGGVLMLNGSAAGFFA